MHVQLLPDAGILTICVLLLVETPMVEEYLVFILLLLCVLIS